VAAVISVVYELWRATARDGVSPNDSMSGWLQGLPIYIVAVVVSVLLIIGWEWAPVAGLIISGGSCLASIVWYGPTILPPRCGRAARRAIRAGPVTADRLRAPASFADAPVRLAG
jgi:hypothetical protein